MMLASPYPSHTSFITADSGFFYTRREEKKNKKKTVRLTETESLLLGGRFQQFSTADERSARSFPGSRFSKKTRSHGGYDATLFPHGL